MSKRLKEAYKSLEEDKAYPLAEALSLLEKSPKVKFDESVELHFHLYVDAKQSDQVVRGTTVLPHGTGKKIRIAVFCKGEDVIKAENAGADIVGGEELVEKVAGGFMDFDCVIATPEMMRFLSKLGKILGPRGMMPSPKAGTVSADVTKAIDDVKAGKIEFRSDKQAGIHVAIGKRTFNQQQLTDNAKHIINAIEQVKPNSIKGQLVKSLYLSSTMGPGIKVNL